MSGERQTIIVTIAVMGTVERGLDVDELDEISRELAEAADRQATRKIAGATAQAEWELGE